jgi:hypothetical protein
MTPDRIAFIKYITLSVRQLITAANGSTLPGIGRGQVRIPININGHIKNIVLTDVLHIPQIAGNLIFIARLQDKGIVVKTTAPPGKMALIIKHQGRKVDVISKVRKSYVLDMPTECAILAKLVTDQQESITDRRGLAPDC